MNGILSNGVTQADLHFKNTTLAKIGIISYLKGAKVEERGPIRNNCNGSSER